MIENHYEFNLAYNGQHFGRVVFPGSADEATAQLRARQIAYAMTETYGSPRLWSFTLTKVNCHGTDVEF
jgi:hypothetical protein